MIDTKKKTREHMGEECYFEIFDKKGKDKLTYFFLLDDSGYPIKLGDGAYGVVYKVCNSSEENYAVKLLYRTKTVDTSTYESFHRTKRAHNDKNPERHNSKQEAKEKDTSAAVSRFRLEMESARTIKKKLRELEKETPIDGVVEIIGGTEKFIDSPAYENLRDKFEEMQTNISEYALVMPHFNCTLKDLLEKGKGKYKIHENFFEKIDVSSKNELEGIKKQIFDKKEDIDSKISEILKSKDLDKNKVPKLIKTASQYIYEVSGYDILKTLEYEDRISTILPYLDKIATGLLMLYRAGQYHYDIKPGNIFIRSFFHKEIDVAIGDLGFLSIADKRDKSATNIREEIPLGTLHYRSPEQKDYFDLCEVDVTETEKLGDKAKQCLALIVHDPKFNNTIMEAGDFVVFAKDTNQLMHKIHEIKKDGKSTRINLERSNPYLKSAKPEQKTQIILYKNHGVRTDLYGFGAIVFDMLTCGKSPERFYDNIRSLDDGENTIDYIKGLYQKVATYQLSEPRFANIFTFFKNENTSKFAPIEIVELILKCMLYRAKGTYFQKTIGEKDPNFEAISLLREDLTFLMTDKKLKFNVEEERKKNTLFLGISKNGDSNKNSQNISVILSNLQKLNDPKDLPLRLAQGIWYFSKLVKFVREKIFDKNDEFIFAEMLPENISFDNDNTEFNYYLYHEEKNYSEYLEDLRNDDLYTKITQNIAYFFVPSKIAFMRREIDLFREKEEENVFSYIFHDSSPFGDAVQIKDWIILKRKLFFITNVDGKKIKLKAQLEEDNSPSNTISLIDESKDEFRCIYYVNLEPSWYYLNMLGIYLYQFFFVGIRNLTKSKPILMNTLESFPYLNKSYMDSIKIYDISVKNEKNKEKFLDSILMALTNLYLRLSLSVIDGSFYKKYGDDKTRIIELLSWVNKIKNMIAAFLEVPPSELEYLQREIKSDHLNSALEKLKNKASESLDINHRILECTNIRNVFTNLKKRKNKRFI